MTPIEKLRAALVGNVRRPFRVSDRRTQYFLDEDTAFYTDIDVQHPTDGFVLVVIRSRDEDHDALIVRALHQHVPEVWFLDDERAIVCVRHRGHEPVALTRDDVITSRQLPSLKIQLAFVLTA